jgi:sulfatase modifying factor 1
MADIFVSYDAQDRVRVSPLIRVFERHGWSVWWDKNVPPGLKWEDYIGRALEEAKCVVVVWSKNSVTSDWVQDEAEEGKQRKILVPVLIDEAKIPMGFRRIQAAHLEDWTARKRAHPQIRILLDSIKRTLNPGAPPTPPPPQRKAETQERKSDTNGDADSSAKATKKPTLSSSKKDGDDNGKPDGDG